MMYSKADNFSGKAFSDGKAQEVSASHTNDGQKSPAMFQKIAAADMTAVRECVDAHGNLIWTLAKKFTDSNGEAEAATQEIFLDLWKYADRFDVAKTSEENFIISFACRCLIKQKSNSVSAAKGLAS